MAARIDLTGQRFGKVEVLQEVEPRIYKSGDKKTQFLCKCDCGRVFKTTSNRLRMGDVHSCGCSREKIRVGQKYGMFTVFEKVKIANGNTEWKCVCECGTIVQMSANRLLNRKNLHCGCQDSLVGQKFNKLLVIEPYGTKERPSGHSVKLWKCLCDCGNYTIIDTNSLKRNHTKSCGCLSTKHLMTKSRIHQIWCGMRKRCHDPNCIAYNNYGGRGISICKDWDDDQNGFVNFWNWSKESGYNEQLTLDRVDVNGDYGPDRALRNSCG